MSSELRRQGSLVGHSYEPWFQRYDFLMGALVLLIAFAVFLLPEGRKPSALEWVLIVFFCFLSLGWVATVTIDSKKPTWVGALSAIGFIFAMGWVFHRYSGTQWDLLGKMFFNQEVMKATWPVLLKGLDKTLSLFLISAIFSMWVGLTLAVVRSFNNTILNVFIVVYIDFFRSIPLLVLAIVVYYALPFLGIQLDPFSAGVVSLVLNSSAFVTESFRSGIESVHRGQIEAARSLGLSSLKTMRLVILPQAFRVVIPPLTGQMVGLIKSTAIISVVGLHELLKGALDVMDWKTNPTPLIVVTILYLVILLPLTRLSGILEKRMKKWVKKT